MNQRKSISFRRNSLLLAHSSLLYALCSMLLAFTLLFALGSPLVAEAADKLVLKDSEGSTKFVVTYTGNVCIENKVPVQ
jgi:hypothetical protein